MVEMAHVRCWKIAPLLIALAFRAAPAFAAGNGDALHFLNGDVMHGKLVAVGSEFVTWQNSETDRAIEFRTSGVADIQFAPHLFPMVSPSIAPGNMRIGLTNGDEIPGSMLTLTGDRLELQTPYAGKITIPRKMLKFVAPARVSAAPVFEGPTGMQGWKSTGDPVWQFRNETLVTRAPGVIGREVEWPDLLSIEFDLSWNGPLGFATGLYFTSLNDTEADGYMLMLGDGSVDLMRSRHGNTEQVGAAADVPALSQNDRTHVKIYVNKKTKTISLLLDGAHIRQWTDRSEFKLRGRMLVFSSQSEAQVKVSRIRVAAWSGRVETEEMETAEQGEDVMRLINGDRVSGKLQSIEKNNVLFYTTHGSLGVPMQKIEDVTLAGRVTPYVEKPREVRAFFCGAGRVTMALEKWDARQAIATLAGAGRATFSTAAFQRLEFHARTASRDDGDEFPDSPAVESPR